MNAEGVDIHRPSVKPLNEMPIFMGEKVPFKCIEQTWKPRISGGLEGSGEYFINRLSIPTFTYSEDIVELYINAFKKVSDCLG